MYNKERKHNITGFLGKSLKYNTDYENELIKKYVEKGLKILEK